MKEIYEVSRRYFEEFESLAAHGGLSWKVLTAGISGVVFLAGICFVLGGAFTGHFSEKTVGTAMPLLMPIAIVCMVFAMMIRYQRDRSLIAKYSPSGSLDTVDDAKKSFLSNELNQPASRFFQAAKHITEIRDLYKANRFNPGFKLRSLKSVFFEESAKPRIVTLVTMLLSAFGLLALRSNEDPAVILQSIILQPQAVTLLIGLYTFMVATTWYVGLTVKDFTAAVWVSFRFWNPKRDSENDSHLNYLIADLTRLSENPIAALPKQ